MLLLKEHSSACRRLPGTDIVASAPPTGKSDTLDAQAAARLVIGRDYDTLARPRQSGPRTALRVLLAARSIIDQQRTANRNALTALLRIIDLGVDAATFDRRPDPCCHGLAHRPNNHYRRATHRPPRGTSMRRYRPGTDRPAQGQPPLRQLTEQLTPGLQDIPGLGPVTAAIIVCAYSHRGRVRSEAAFAALGGIAPLPLNSPSPGALTRVGRWGRLR